MQDYRAKACNDDAYKHHIPSWRCCGVVLALHTMLLLQHLTPLAHKEQAGVPKDRGEDGVANSVATTHLRHHGDGSRFSRILTVSNDLSLSGRMLFRWWQYLASRCTSATQERTLDRRQFRVFLPHKRSMVAISNATDASRWRDNSEAHDFRRGPIWHVGAVYSQWVSIKFILVHVVKTWWLIRRPSWSDIVIFSTVLVVNSILFWI